MVRQFLLGRHQRRLGGAALPPPPRGRLVERAAQLGEGGALRLDVLEGLGVLEVDDEGEPLEGALQLAVVRV